MTRKGDFIEKYEGIEKLYEEGLSIADIASAYGVSRQSMWMCLKRRGVEMRPQLRFGNDNHFFRGVSKKNQRATSLVGAAKRKGILQELPCEICGTLPVEAHHDDYNKPLEVRWLCKLHHYEWHTQNEAIGIDE